MGSSTRILDGIIWSIAYNVINALYSFFAIPILINHFGKAEYGLIALATSVNAYMQLMDMGLNSTNVRFFSAWLADGDKERIRKLFSTSNFFYGCVGLLNALILILLNIYADTVFNLNVSQCAVLKKLLIILSVASIINWYTSCYNQLIQATENVAWTQKRLLLTKCLLVLSLLATLIFNLSIIQYFFLTVLSVWIILPLVVCKVRSLIPYISFKPSFDWSVFKEILPYSINIFSFTIFSLSYNNLRTVFLGVRGNVENVTEWSVINNIAFLCSMACGVFLSALLPSSSKAIAKGDKVAYYKIAYQGTKYIMLFVSFCVFLLLSVASELLVLYVGESYLNLLPWLFILILTLLSNHILGISSLILGGENILPLSKMTAISSVCALLAAWFLIPSYQVGGVVLATVIYNVIQQLFYYLYYWPHILHINSKYVFIQIDIPIILIGIVSFISSNFISIVGNIWLEILLKSFSYILVYVLISLIYLNRTDKQFIKSLIIKRNENRKKATTD